MGLPVNYASVVYLMMAVVTLIKESKIIAEFFYRLRIDGSNEIHYWNLNPMLYFQTVESEDENGSLDVY